MTPRPSSLDPSNPVEVASPSRRRMLAAGALVCGASLVASGTAHALGGASQNSLCFLETLELLQTDFYERVATSAGYEAMEPRERDVMATLAEQDRQHGEWFRLARDRYGVESSAATLFSANSGSRTLLSYNFPGAAFATRRSVFDLAISIKETAVGAYHGQLAMLSNLELVGAIAALAGVEGRHAATLREISGINPIPNAFDAALDAGEVNRRLGRYGFRPEATR